jgi:hypothetical protein
MSSINYTRSKLTAHNKTIVLYSDYGWNSKNIYVCGKNVQFDKFYFENEKRQECIFGRRLRAEIKLSDF